MMLKDLLPPGLRPVQSAPDLIAGVLREAIAGNRLVAGRPLRQAELAAELGVSRIPLREALRQLEAEGLVRHSPNRGAVVSELSWHEVAEICEMRLALESLAVSKVAAMADAPALDAAAAILDEAEAEDDAGRLGTLNHRFHTTLYAAAGRPLLLTAIERLHHNVNRYMRLVLGDLGHQRTSQDEHRRLLEACRAGDATKAVMVLAGHIEGAGDLLVEHLKERKRR